MSRSPGASPQCILPLQWDLTFFDDHMERCFIKQFNRSLLPADKVHCALLLLVALLGAARSLASDGPQWAGPSMLTAGAVTSAVLMSLCSWNVIAYCNFILRHCPVLYLNPGLVPECQILCA